MSDVKAIAKELAKEIGIKLLSDGILKVERRPDCVIVTMENILLPDIDTERFVKIILPIQNESLYLSLPNNCIAQLISTYEALLGVFP